MIGEAYQRAGYQTQSDGGTEVSSNGSGQNLAGGGDDVNYGELDGERPVQRMEIVLTDPGPFRYNRKVCIAAIPCLLLILAICGEMLVLLVSASIALILIVDTGSNNQRTMVVFMLIFVPCHITILYFTFPLIWVSYINIILMGLMNSFILLSGAWAVIQIAIFRMQEPDICIFIEQMLFSLYPGLSACLLTWAAGTVIPLKFVSIVLLFISFALLQVFMTPTTSSFKLKTAKEGENTDILNSQQIVAMAIVFNILPSVVHVLVGLYQVSVVGVLQSGFLCENLFLLCLSLLLTTLLSVRQVIEDYSLSYSFMVRLRAVVGALCTVLSYPILLNFGITSHFLPWLPVAIAVYAMYGFLLSYKQYKKFAVVLYVVASLMSIAWSLKLPWQLSYSFMFGLTQNQVFLLMVVNSVLCLSSVYAAFQGSEQFFKILILVQTAIFIGGEVILYESDLYKQPLFLLTTLAALYTFQRLYVGRLLPQGVSCACMAAHLTKSVIVLMYVFIHQSHRFHYFSILTLYFLLFMVLRMFLNEDNKGIVSKNQLLINLGLTCLSVGMNVNPFMYILSSYLFGVDASIADVIGFCCVICGILIVTSSIVHLPEENSLRKVGIMGIFGGILVILIQPSISLTWYGLFQVFELLSLFLTVLLLSGVYLTTVEQIAVTSLVLGICPGIQVAFYLYPEDALSVITMVNCSLWSINMWCIIFCVAKSEHLGLKFEKAITVLCLSSGMQSALSLLVDLVIKDKKDAILDAPSWKLFLCSNVVVCICLKLFIFKNADSIPLYEKEDKEVSALPLVGNITSVTAFLLACLLGPTNGFLHDIWCCGAAIIFTCMQRDMRIVYTLREENQTAITKMVAICVLIAGTIYRSDLWHSASRTFLRSFVEVTITLFCIPMYIALWLILWRSSSRLPEVVVVLTVPLNFALAFYGSSYTSWALAATGLFSGVWMMSTHFQLKPNSGLA